MKNINRISTECDDT